MYYNQISEPRILVYFIGGNMKFAKLKSYMSNLPMSKLKYFLGDEIVDNLLEWTPENQPLFTKRKLIEMILSVHGINILKNSEFRRSLVMTFKPEQILGFSDLLSQNHRGTSNISTIINEVVLTPWKRNKISQRILQIIEIDYDIFDLCKERNDDCYTIEAGDRFYELLDYQFVIKQRLLHNLTNGVPLNRMLVHMPTGTGKTKTAMHTICHHYNFNLNGKGLIIWVAHTTELLEQAFDTFESVWSKLGKGEIAAIKLWGNSNIDERIFQYNGIIFCGIQKLIALERGSPLTFKQLVKHCNLVVFDEAHKALATETKRTIEQFMIKKADMCDRSLIGLTATPGRSTEQSAENDLLARMFENNIISIDTRLVDSINLSQIEALNANAENDVIAYFQSRGVLSNIKKEELRYPESLSKSELTQIKDMACLNGYNDFTPKTLEIIGRNKNRNLTIIKRIIELDSVKMPTIVFACSVEHGKLLSAMLSINNIQNALVIGDMPSKERADSIAAFKDPANSLNILINYEVLTTGFDSTNIKCVLIARPTQSVVLYSQMLGRGLRGPQMGGNKECLLIDIKDNLDQFDEKLAFKHFNNYWRVSTDNAT